MLRIHDIYSKIVARAQLFREQHEMRGAQSILLLIESQYLANLNKI